MSEMPKRKLNLKRETIRPLQPSALARVLGGDDNNLVARTAESAAVGSVAGGAVSAFVAESAGTCFAAGGAASAGAAAVDHVSDKLGVPCYLATSLGSVALHWTRRW